MTKIVGIMASPRRRGNTDILLDKALEGAGSAGAATEKIVLNDLDFRPCQECGGCDKKGICVIRDDLRPVYNKVEEADGLVMASPVFFGSVSAQAKMLIDRFNSYWIKKHVLRIKSRRRNKRRGLFLCVSATPSVKFFRYSRSVIRNFYALLDIEYSGELYCAGVERAGDIAANLKVLNKAYDLGADLASALMRKRR